MRRRPLWPALRRARRERTVRRGRAAVLPWPARAAVLLALLALGAALGSGLYEYARRAVGLSPPISRDEVLHLQADLQRLEADNDKLQERLSASDSRLAIERAEKDQLAAEFRAAQKEMGDLRNDLAFFEQLIPPDPRLGQISIRSTELERQGQALRYRVLLMRNGRPSGEFKGELQFTAFGTRGGGSATVELQPFAAGDGTPGAADASTPASAPLALSFRQYQRAEGMLQLPAGFVARSVTVRVMEKGVVRSQSSVDLPA